jgi:glycolate oxidase FAD binding subunit
MTDAIAPGNTKELEQAIAWALSSETALEIIGQGTKRVLGRPVQAGATLDMRHFSGISLYEPEELVLEAGAATPLAEIEKALEAKNQQLAFEPPDLSGLLGSAGGGTLGGLISCNLSGPRRLKAGAARDHVLAVSGVSGRGEAFKAGARVVKNVTGYDLPKLMTGAWGTLAALTTIAVKVLPRPATESTVIVEGLTPERAAEAMSLAMQSSCEISGAAHLPAAVAKALSFKSAATLLRLEGIAESVAYRKDKLAALLKPLSRVTDIPEAESAKVWTAIRNVKLLDAAGSSLIWRISVAPSEGVKLLAAFPGRPAYLDWAGGLVWLELPYAEDAAASSVRAAFTEGHAMLVRAPHNLRLSTPVFQPQAGPLAALSQRVKNAFDPKGILNPGRMYSGV